MRQIWFGLLAIAAGASFVSVGCGDTGTSSNSTGTTTTSGGESSSTSGSGGAGGSGGAAATTSTTAASSSTTASSTTATSGTTASSSSSGTGGAGGCTTSADCPMVDTECVTATCVQGVCGLVNLPDQTPTPSQTAGDCQKVICDGQGNGVSKADDTDVPDDSKACTKDTCNGGVPSHTALASGSVCVEGMGKLCDGAGTCVECLANSDCTSGLCSANACVTVNGCGPATATDLTAVNTNTINFGGAFGFAYVPKCIKVKVGSKVKLDGLVVGAFGSHPFMGGEVKNGVKVPAVSGPFIPVTNDPAISSKTFTMTSAGTFPFYCDFHALGGMTGTVFVVP